MSTLSDGEIENRLSQLEDWHREGEQISKHYRFANFKEALAFVNQVGELAELANHHPDIKIHGYKFVDLVLSTHSVGRLTEKDFDLAAQIDA